MRLFLSLFIFSHISIAAEFNQKDVDSMELFLNFPDTESITFLKEKKLLLDSLKGSSLEAILNAILLFRDGEEEEGYKLFISVKEKDPYFELMVGKFHESLFNADKLKKKYVDSLAELTYETHLREKQELETGCVHGLQEHYSNLIKNDLKKKKSFDAWLEIKRKEFNEQKAGNWYLTPGHDFPVNLEKIKAVTESIEPILLGFSKPDKSFNEKWKLVKSVRAELNDLLLLYGYNIQPLPYAELDSILEEVRLNVLSGKTELVKDLLKNLKPYIPVRQDVKGLDIQEQKPSLSDLWAKYYYIRGLNYYLAGMNKKMKGQDFREDLIGKKSAIVSFYFSHNKGKDSLWVKKSKKLFDIIYKNSKEWFGVRLVDIFKHK